MPHLPWLPLESELQSHGKKVTINLQPSTRWYSCLEISVRGFKPNGDTVMCEYVTWCLLDSNCGPHHDPLLL